MSSSVFNDLEKWYEAQRDGDWEHAYGIAIGTIDNPGWFFTVDLTGTPLEHVPFEEYKFNFEDEREWFICSKQETDKKFTANGGPLMLEAMVRTFLDWAASIDSD